MKKTVVIQLAGLAIFSVLGLASAEAETSPWSMESREEPARMGSFTHVPDEGFRIQFEAPPGDFDILFSEDLSGWSVVGTASPSALGNGTFTHLPASTADKGFYRVGGSYTAEDYHMVLPSTEIDYGGFTEEGAVQTGSLRYEVSREKWALQYANDEAGLFTFSPGESGAGGVVRPLLPDVSFSDFESGASRMPFDFTNDGLLLHIPERTYSSVGPEGDEGAVTVDEAFDIPLLALDENRGVIFGLGTGRNHTVEEAGDPGIRIDGRNIGLLLAARKSIAADARDLAGPWGMVTLMVNAGYDEGSEEGATEYSTNAYVLQAASSSPAGGQFTVTRGTEFLATQGFSGGSGVEANHEEFTGNIDLPFEVEADGTFLFEDNGPGFVASSQDLFVWQDAFGNDGEIETKYGVGVLRDVVPALAGKTYRIIQHGFWAEDGAFEINAGLPGDTLVFDAEGDSVERRSTLATFGATFDGNGDEGEETYAFTSSVSVDSDGQITIEGSVPGKSQQVRSFGFAQAGSELLVLADAMETDDGLEAGVGIIIATEVDPAPEGEAR